MVLDARCVSQWALGNASLTTSVTLEDDAVNGILAALVLCHGCIAAVRPYLDQIDSLDGIAGTLDFIAVLISVRVRLFLAKTLTRGQTKDCYK